MVGLTTQNFVSAGAAMAVAGALTRAFGANRSQVIGNFWSDVVRVTLYFLLPLSIVLSLILAALGLPQTLAVSMDTHTVEGLRQSLALGPFASQVAIAQIGTNGAGFFDAGAAHPFINPSGVSNFIEAATLAATGLACIFAFGRTLYARGEARAIVTAVVLLVAAAASAMYLAEAAPMPATTAVHAELAANMEGKEVRFGAPASAAFTALSAGARNGSTNADIESLTPASSGLSMFLMQLGGMLPGSAGAGLITVVMFSLLAVVVGGLVVGRTPEFLGKRVEMREIRLVISSLLILNLSILGFSAVAADTPAGLVALSTGGPHGLMEILYGYTSAVANTGSAFQGLHADNAYWCVTLGLAMAAGRYAVLLPALVIASALAAKPKMRPTDGTFPTDGPLFIGLLLGVLVILSGLQYFPSMTLGPIVEQIQLNSTVRRATASSAPLIVTSPYAARARLAPAAVKLRGP
jgi:K+-transporting ATPase ATPase A chain